MKRFFLTAFLLLALVRLSPAQPSNAFINNGSIISPPANPPQIDATNFINNGQINVTFALQLSPFDFSDVQNYTNNGSLICNTGFNFNDSPSSSGSPTMSATFGNGNAGYIAAGSALSNLLAIELVDGPAIFPPPLLEISATNIINTGTLDIGTYGNLTITGNTVNLARGTVHVEGFDDPTILSNFLTIGIDPVYWGEGKQTNLLGLGSFLLPDPISPLSIVTTVAGAAGSIAVAPPQAAVYANTNMINASNFTYQVVFINTNLPGISTDVRFVPGGDGGFGTPVIHWQAVLTNISGRGIQTTVTNDLYLSDIYGSTPTNYLVTNGYTTGGNTLQSPYNYTFYRLFPGYAAEPTANDLQYDPTTIFANAFQATNAYSAYGVTLEPTTSFPDPSLPDSTVQNSPGRIELTANTSLDLTGAKITGANYLDLTSTNHFVGSAGATIIAPFIDINLGTTNGVLAVSNLFQPAISRFTGPISMYSARWTNIIAGATNVVGGVTNIVAGGTNAYHVFIVDAEIAGSSLPLVLNCLLRSTNVFISDVLNIESNLLVNATSLTITSNSPGAANPFGEINLLSSDILWSPSFPVLQSLTNFGSISSQNLALFFTASSDPYYSTNVGLFSSFVNHGLISSFGISIGANYVENTGVGSVFSGVGFSNSAPINTAFIDSSVGPVSVQAGSALLANASILAPDGDIAITAGSLIITNHVLQASGALSFSVSNSLADGGAASSNFWTAGNGMNLYVKPATGDFLGTTITLTAPPELEVDDIWAGRDEGPVQSGFRNNGAVGHLILDGGDDFSQFYFGGLDSTNLYAIYVDQLDLRDGATYRADENGVEVFAAFDLAPNFKIYYADAVEAGNDISEKMNGSNGGSLVWVPSYAGIFSSTNLIYPAGVTNTLNRALVQSTDIDSNDNGVANAFDPMPIYTSYDVNLTVSLTNLPPKVPVLKWSGLANSTNIVFFKTNLNSPNWTVLTNFVFGPANGVATVIDRGRTNSMAYYMVQVIAALP